MLAEYQNSIGKIFDITVQIRLDKAKDVELLQTMRRAGIYTIAIGMESPIEEELALMNKKLKPEDMLENIRLFHAQGFLVHGMFIFAYPAKDDIRFDLPIKERIKRFKRFIRKSGLDTIQVLLPIPLPGTELRERLKERIYALADIGWQYYDGNFVVFEPKAPLTAEEMQHSIPKIMGMFYRFRHMFFVGMDVFSFLSLIFSLHNLKHGWRRWYRNWRNHIIRFGGWITIRKWKSFFKEDSFLEKLKKARR